MVVDGAVYKRTSTPPLVKQMRPSRGVFCFYIPKGMPKKNRLAQLGSCLLLELEIAAHHFSQP